MSNREHDELAEQSDQTAYDYTELAAEGLPIPDNDSFRGETADLAEREALRLREIEFAQAMANRAYIRKEAADARHQPTDLIDEGFDRQMSRCEIVEDPDSGLPYSVFQLNGDKEGRPLVLFLGVTTVAQKGAGRDVVHEFAMHVDRPIVVIEHEGAGKSGTPDKEWLEDVSLQSMGESRLRVLDALARSQGKDDFGDFDLAGYSLGGGVALATAAAAGERAREVVTIQTEGFDDDTSQELRGRAKGLRRDMKSYTDRVESEIVARNKEARGQGEKPPKASLLGKIRSVRGQAKVVLTGAQSAKAAGELDPTTHWTTIVGSEDALTDWQSHLGAVRERIANSENAHNSSVHVLAGDTHYSVKERRAEMAEMVAQVLERRQETTEADLDLG